MSVEQKKLSVCEKNVAAISCCGKILICSNVVLSIYGSSITIRIAILVMSCFKSKNSKDE